MLCCAKSGNTKHCVILCIVLFCAVMICCVNVASGNNAHLVRVLCSAMCCVVVWYTGRVGLGYAVCVLCCDLRCSVMSCCTVLPLVLNTEPAFTVLCCVLWIGMMVYCAVLCYVLFPCVILCFCVLLLYCIC